MRVFALIVMSFITVTALSACNVTARDGDSSITVNNPDGYNHCPPGHAKKGWC